MDAASSIVVAAVDGFALTPDEDRFFREESPAGVTLFRRNIPQDDYQSVLRLNTMLQASRPAGAPPLVIAIDQEGGRVSRLPKAFPNLGPALYIADGKTDTTALAVLKEYGAKVGKGLLEIGINVDFAPVLDVLTEPTNTAIGDRVFGVTPDQATPRANAFLDGLQSTGVMGSLKHFPGQGDAKVDTHLGGAKIDISLQTFWTRELVPFRSMINAAPMVMVSHCIYPFLCRLEASRSPIIIGDWLRGRLGFKGVVVSDDMNMGALPQEIKEWQEILIDSVVAGCDALLVCKGLDRCYAAIHGLRREAARSPAFRLRLEEAAKMVTTMRTQLK